MELSQHRHRGSAFRTSSPTFRALAIEERAGGALSGDGGVCTKLTVDAPRRPTTLFAAAFACSRLLFGFFATLTLRGPSASKTDSVGSRRSGRVVVWAKPAAWLSASVQVEQQTLVGVITTAGTVTSMKSRAWNLQSKRTGKQPQKVAGS
ncbi:hypothetical protein FISHEDRAFT_70043 [Fistulina hepatica ATCC 64428]|uniref:Uncharacterized protein n=1 Tax=Fistulina hepatica ATCC 64428 TaxID=1128425 RepID=A0A0D7AKH0_9AGAR|nr:hypothetical protein FISHEDRAFT_70043 [Fistulina hepatica ATCC 64428]